MAETDDIVASLRAWAPLVASGYTVPAAGQVMENAATALTEQAAQIERLTRERDEARRFCSAAYHDLVGLFETIKENKDLFPRTTHDLIETSEFMKLAAEGLADGTVYEDELSNEKARATTAERERDEARAEVERLRKVVKIANDAIAEYVRYLDGGEMRGSYDGKPERNGLRKAGYATRAALTKGGENGDA